MQRIAHARSWQRAIGGEPPSRANVIRIAVYTALLASAEAVLAYYSAALGAALHAVLVGGLLFHYLAPRTEPPDANRWLAPGSPVLPVLAQLSLLRLLSLVMPTPDVPIRYVYALVGVPGLLGALLAARLVDVSWRDVGFVLRINRRQLAIAASGLLLGLVGYAIVRPSSPADADTWSSVALTAPFVIVFVGLLEEILFRGLLQRLATRDMGSPYAVGWSSVIYGVMYLGSGSALYTLFMAACGLLFGWWYARDGALWSVVIAHALLAVSLLLVFPLLFG
jgi:membrane protease YdiL (CAAX protease family)